MMTETENEKDDIAFRAGNLNKTGDSASRSDSADEERAT